MRSPRRVGGARSELWKWSPGQDYRASSWSCRAAGLQSMEGPRCLVTDWRCTLRLPHMRG